MQIILVGAGIVSLAIQEWSTALLLFILTRYSLNAVIGLREEGKAESAMNALKSMMKATTRVRRRRRGRCWRRSGRRRRHRAARSQRSGTG